jgi:DNA-binding MarR family transcriptional regulator
MYREDDRRLKTAFDALRRVVRGLRVAADEVERRSAITLAQRFVLGKLADGRPRSVAELAAETLTDPSSASGLVKRLVAAGLVSRAQSKGDARRAAVQLTPAGKRLAARLPETPQTRLLRAMGKLPKTELLQMTKALETLARALGQDEPALFFEGDAPAGRRRARNGR